MKELSTTEMENQGNDITTKPEDSIPASEIPVKHPLENKWTLWFFENDKNKDWLLNLHEVYSFDTVEDFWCLYNHIRQVSDLTQGNDYMLFKYGIQPTWEDKANKGGGRWLVNIDNKQKQSINELWLNVLLFMIGENFDEYSDEICGAFINIRNKIDKISLWTADASKKDEVIGIGEKLKYNCLHFPRDLKITYEKHEDSQNKNSSKMKHSYTC